jgi:chromosome segregation ATPase
MLDTLRALTGNGKGQKQAEELQALVASAREERAALSAMLTQISIRSAKLAQMSRSLEQAGERADAAASLIEGVSQRMSALDDRLALLDTVEKRLNGLTAHVADVQRATERLTAPDSEIDKHRQAVAVLVAQTQETQAAIESLRGERAAVDDVRAQIRQVTADVKQSQDSAAIVRGELDGVRTIAAQLGQGYHRIRETSRGARDEALAASDAVKHVENKLGSIAQLRELAVSTEERLASLNSLSEHVSHKIKALDAQKHTIDHATVQTNRVNEMLRAMDLQIGRLAEGHKQVKRAEETLARIEQLARDSDRQLESAMSARDDFSRDIVRLEREGRTLTEYLKQQVERLSVERKELDTFDQRMNALHSGVTAAESRMECLFARDKAVAALTHHVETLVKDFQTLAVRADELMRKQDALDPLAERLDHVDELGRRLVLQQDSLTKSRADFEQMRQELQEFQKTYAEAVQLRDRLSRDRAALEVFGERTATLLARTPAIEARMSAVLDKLHLIDEGTKSAERLEALAAELDAQLTRVADRGHLVDALEERLGTLHTLTADVGRRLSEQLARRNEVDTFRTTLDTVVTQVSDAQQRLDGMAAVQQKIVPLSAEVVRLLDVVTHTRELVNAIERDDASVVRQQTALTELVEQSRHLAVTAGDRLTHMQGMCNELARASALKDELLSELSLVQARQRDVASHAGAAEEQIKRAEAMLRQLEQRRSQLAFAEKKITTFESRLNELKQQSDSIDGKIAAIADRDGLVQSVRAEVENIREITARSKADVNFVAEHRHEVATARAQVEDLLSRVGDTEQRLAGIDARRRMVEDVHARVHTIDHLIEDISVNLDMLGEQKAVIEHVGEKLARLDFMVQEASSTLRALQHEREVAERIEQSIKSLRTRTVSEAKSA